VTFLHAALLLMVSTEKLVLSIYYFHADLIVMNEIMPFKAFVYCDVERKVSFLPGF
jgi:hypothetical protein